MSKNNSMIRTLFLIGLAIISLAAQCNQEMDFQEFIYIDGSNNSFQVSAKSLNYEPMVPLYSNTGSYSGGAKQELALSAAQHQELIELAKAALLDTEHHLSNRPKGSGTLRVKDHRVVLAAASPSKGALESALRALLP